MSVTKPLETVRFRRRGAARGGAGRVRPAAPAAVVPRQRVAELAQRVSVVAPAVPPAEVRQAVAPSATAAPPPARGGSYVARANHLLTVVLAGLLVGWATGADLAAVTVAVLVTVLVRGHNALDGLRPEVATARALVGSAAVPLVVVAVAADLGLLAPGHLAGTALAVGAALGGDLFATAARRRTAGPTRVLLVGGPATLDRALAHWTTREDVTVVGALALAPAGSAPVDAVHDGSHHDHGVDVVALDRVDQVREHAGPSGADVVVALPDDRLDADALRTLNWLLERTDTPLAVAGHLDVIAPHRIVPRRLGAVTVVQTRASLPPRLERAAKWVFDRVAGLLLLLVAAPLLALCYAAVRIDSPGSGLFRQVRVGRDGRPFSMIKLRTMRQDAESVRHTLVREDDGNGVLFKMHHDPRITRIGRLLRKTSLDELPQLVNVVLGHMSLVGPRPALPAEVAAYDAMTHRRYVVRPGMTGLWQVSGRSDLSWHESRELDLYYVDNHRFVGDLAIGWRTVGAVLGSKGAY